MGKVISGMSMSLDGFVADRDGDLSPLYPDFEAILNSEPLQESIRRTGAVVLGRRAYAMGDPDSYADNYEYQTPIFVLTHTVPEKHPRQNEKLTITFVTDGVESAIRQAKAAAGDRDVTVVGGPSTIRQCLAAGLVDEIHILLIPVLLGAGLRLFDDPGQQPLNLEIQQVFDFPGMTYLKYNVLPRTSPK